MCSDGINMSKNSIGREAAAGSIPLAYATSASTARSFSHNKAGIVYLSSLFFSSYR